MASTSSVTCPECGVVLRPAKPLAAGKSVKCPKCGAGFVVGAGRPRAAEQRAASPIQKKPAAGAVPVAPLVQSDDDEESAGTYSFKGETQTDAPEVDYLSEVEIKDLRGPAMSEVIDPSNKLIIVGTTGFLGWVAFLVILIIPILFPLETKEQRAKARAQQLQQLVMTRGSGAPKQLEEETSFLTIGSIDLRAIGEYRWYTAVLFLIPLVLGMIYSAILCVGAVKIQNLEAREWGVAASVMAMVPLNAGGLLCILTLVLNLGLDLLFEGYFKWVVLVFFLICAWGTNLAVGIWMLTTLNKPEVIAGYDYVAE
jgi:hypothetical protein